MYTSLNVNSKVTHELLSHIYSFTETMDFVVSTTKVTIGVGQPMPVQFSLPIDMVALELDETFQIILTRQDTQPLGSNQFFMDTLTVTIQDADGKLKLAYN